MLSSVVPCGVSGKIIPPGNTNSLAIKLCYLFSIYHITRMPVVTSHVPKPVITAFSLTFPPDMSTWNVTGVVFPMLPELCSAY